MVDPPLEYDPQCPLCVRHPITHHFYEDELIWIVECKTCGVPMLVIKRHDTQPSYRERLHAREIKHRLFPHSQWDESMQSIKEHWHTHFR